MAIRIGEIEEHDDNDPEVDQLKARLIEAIRGQRLPVLFVVFEDGMGIAANMSSTTRLDPEQLAGALIHEANCILRDWRRGNPA